MSNTAPSRADPVVVFPLGRWCPPQETSQHPPPPRWRWVKGEQTTALDRTFQKDNIRTCYIIKHYTLVRSGNPNNMTQMSPVMILIKAQDTHISEPCAIKTFHHLKTRVFDINLFYCTESISAGTKYSRLPLSRACWEPKFASAS